MDIVNMSQAGGTPSGSRFAPVQRTLFRRARDRVHSFLENGNTDYERRFLFVRPLIALLVIAAAVLSGDLPGRTGVIIGCSIAIGYNFMLGALIYAGRIHLQRATSLVFDNLTVICTSLWVFMQMGRSNYESDLWLIYMTLIVSNSLYYGPIGSLFFSSMYVGLFTGMTTLFYDGGSYSHEQLPVRLTFFVLTALVSMSLSAELRKRSASLEVQSRQTLSMLAQIVEARDTDAGEHLKHITHYSRALALHIGQSEEAAKEIAYAAMIHDVGKAQVPDAILKKPGPLTPAERREIEKHTVWGHQLLADNDEFSAAADVARWHHERWDGTGYPDGLAGEAIPLSARIAAVADVYDALTSERPYKRAWPAREAIAEIKRLRGTHLDPTIVDAFLELYQAGVLLRINQSMRDDTGGFGLAA